MKKLHLGCGQKYLDGYINIDFPQTEHSVQTDSIADRHENILTMKYPEDVSEIRLHHVFEHFSHAEACVLLTKWHLAMAGDGSLRIEVPDMERSACMLLNPFLSFKRKCVVERHLFGSHEAHWAVHHVGYTKQSLRDLLERFGFKVQKINRSKWRDTRNITIVARKNKDLDQGKLKEISEKYLENFLVDGSDSEKKLLRIWKEQYHKILLQ